MNEVNQTLFIPLYGKAQVSRQNIILSDRKAEEIWARQAFRIKGTAKSKWLAYYMAMRARVFDDWTDAMLRQNQNALVLHIGCGLDSRYLRVKESCGKWIDADFPEVIEQRKQYFAQTETYRMAAVDASNPEDIRKLPDAAAAIVVMEGVSMYLTNGALQALLACLREKYAAVHLLMDVYTEFAAKASKYKNPVNEVGVTTLYGVAGIGRLAAAAKLAVKAEHSLTPDRLIDELKGFERIVFKTLYAGSIAGKLYRLYELEG